MRSVKLFFIGLGCALLWAWRKIDKNLSIERQAEISQILAEYQQKRHKL